MSKCIECGSNFVGTPENLPQPGLCKYCEIKQLKAAHVRIGELEHSEQMWDETMSQFTDYEGDEAPWVVMEREFKALKQQLEASQRDTQQLRVAVDELKARSKEQTQTAEKYERMYHKERVTNAQLAAMVSSIQSELSATRAAVSEAREHCDNQIINEHDLLDDVASMLENIVSNTSVPHSELTPPAALAEVLGPTIESELAASAILSANGFSPNALELYNDAERLEKLCGGGK